MAFKTTRDLLDSALADNLLVAADLDKLIVDHVKENQYLEYKDGKLLSSKKSKPAETVREYVSGFANADGGVLIVGVSEDRPRKVTGCKKPGGKPLDEWAKDCLIGMTGQFSPQPRFQLVSHPNGEVLVCAVARAPALIPCVVSGRMTYFLRIHDSTVPAPEHLASDLILGRRNHPLLEISKTRLVSKNRTFGLRGGFSNLDFRLDVGVSNWSMKVAEDVRVGVVCWAVLPDESSVTDHLATHVNFQQPAPLLDANASGAAGLRWKRHHMQVTLGKEPDIGPFDQRLVELPSFILHGQQNRRY